METAAVPACDSVSRNENGLEGETSASALKGADLNGTQTKELIEAEVDGCHLGLLCHAVERRDSIR
jgi:hypothetical protein